MFKAINDPKSGIRIVKVLDNGTELTVYGLPTTTEEKASWKQAVKDAKKLEKGNNR